MGRELGSGQFERCVTLRDHQIREFDLDIVARAIFGVCVIGEDGRREDRSVVLAGVGVRVGVAVAFMRVLDLAAEAQRYPGAEPAEQDLGAHCSKYQDGEHPPDHLGELYRVD